MNRTGKLLTPPLLFGTLLLSSALPAAAAPSAGGGCQAGFELVTVKFALRQATTGFEDSIRAMDQNRDRLLCYKLLPTAIPLFEPTFLFYDNDQPLH
jgi:hypothetical protein